MHRPLCCVSVVVRLARAFTAAALGYFPLLTGPAQVRAMPGDLDLTFRDTGWTHVPEGIPGPKVTAMAVQPDRKIVLTGVTRTTVAGPTSLAVWRFHPDGSRDTTFNCPGVSLPAEVSVTGDAVLLRTGGRILVSGSWLPKITIGVPIQTHQLLASFMPDGRPDPSFGPSGQGFIQSTVPGRAGSLALQDGEKILTGGMEVFPARLTRWLPSGDVDTSFGTEGSAALPTSGGCNTVAVQADGKIVVLRDATFLTVNRLLPNGAVDNTFGNAGTALHDPAYPGNPEWFRSLQITPDGKILCAGHFFGGPSVYYGLIAARLLPNGAQDTAFGEPAHPGRTLATVDNDMLTFAGMTVQSDGRILLAGAAGVEGAPPDTAEDVALLRLNADGRRDQTFGTAGLVRSDLGRTADIPRAIALLTDQKLLVAGGYVPQSASPQEEEILLARYQVPGSLTLSVEHPRGQEAWALDFGPVTAGIRIIEVTLHNTGTTTLTNLQAVLTDTSIPGDYRVVPPGAASLAPGATIAINVTLEPSTPGPRTATLHVTAGNPGFVPRILLLTGAKATPLEIWRTTWFGSPDNSGHGADLNDFDHDGLPNFMEYATASLPHQPSPSPLHPAPDATSAISFTYTRPTTALTEFSWQPELAPSPAGPWSSAGLTSTVLTSDGTLQTIKVTPAPGGNPPARQFLRLRVTRQ